MDVIHTTEVIKASLTISIVHTNLCYQLWMVGVVQYQKQTSSNASTTLTHIDTPVCVHRASYTNACMKVHMHMYMHTYMSFYTISDWVGSSYMYHDKLLELAIWYGTQRDTRCITHTCRQTEYNRSLKSELKSSTVLTHQASYSLYHQP